MFLQYKGTTEQRKELLSEKSIITFYFKNDIFCGSVRIFMAVLIVRAQCGKQRKQSKTFCQQENAYIVVYSENRILYHREHKQLGAVNCPQR